MKYIAAFDIGTTSVKGLLFTRKGEVKHAKELPLHTIFLEGNKIEQDPESWYKAVINMTQDWFKNDIEPDDITCIVMSGQMEDFIPVDKNKKAIRNAILYSDTRAEKQAEKICSILGKNKILESTGNNFQGQKPCAKLLWCKEEEPELFEEIDSFFISSKDYIINKLTGIPATDATSASTAGLMNIETRKWDIEFIDKLGFDQKIFPAIFNAHETVGVVTKEGSLDTGFKVGTPVLAGAGDGGSSTLGAGVASSGQMYIYLGTTGWIGYSSSTVEKDQAIFNLAAMPEDLFIHVAPFLNVGGVHKWVVNMMTEEQEIENPYKCISQKMEKIKAGSDGVVFLPYLNGERFPVQESSSMGTYIGISSITTKAHLCKSAIEGVSYSIRQGKEYLTNHHIDRMIIIGGGAKEPIWCQIFADVLNVEIFVPEEAQYLPAAGTVAAAFVNLKWVNNYQEFVKKYIMSLKGITYKPILENVEVYNEAYKKYIKIYPAIKAL